MRIAIYGLLGCLGLLEATAASAADFDFGSLRGGSYEPVAAPSLATWEGIYVGGHGGWSSTNFGFGSVFQPLVADHLRGRALESILGASSLLSAVDSRRDGATFGAFAGINYQFDEVVAGVEFDYTHAGITGRSADRTGRYIVGSDGYLYGANLSGEAATRLDDYATIRARFGYTVGGFLPYVTGGFAVGRAQISETVAVRAYEYDQATYRSNQALADPSQRVYVNNSGYANFIQGNPGGSTLAAPDILHRSKEKIVGGIAAGAGLEYAITPGLILRAEYQYVLFNDFDGHKLNVNTVRGGAAVKF
ncbi:hypothetical protein OPKNFCMD_2229 [Methylobacterium crusticola]|uniref:Outer membrane protein beta-barrel domain-containing protein n=1 Tax=Methylobacterium crusticola TaxID=1697972 RepID=A0ABQ4QVV7_9HYPH|nr:outer membrane beta-barrel protein [Methylobacterium crusticola]GJD49498.1 hypothetical protein OPKNFCMD_2229 [Methylobacterium crusticola]